MKDPLQQLFDKKQRMIDCAKKELHLKAMMQPSESAEAASLKARSEHDAFEAAFRMAFITGSLG